jgi:AraC family transcriptional regulator
MSRSLGAIFDISERLAQSATAIANLCVSGAGEAAPEHRHANPYLWLHVLGAHREAGDGGEQRVDGPTAMFFPAGSAHRMDVGAQGLASVIIEFDAGWLRRRLGPRVDLNRPRLWAGGEAGGRASRLAHLWLSASEHSTDRFVLSEGFLDWAVALPPPSPPPACLEELAPLIESSEGEGSCAELSMALGVRQPWLARTYRRWRGEGLPSALRRRRVAAAAMMIETTDMPLAQIALAAGFCDQSHMNRGFQRVIGRTPAALRAAKLGLASPRLKQIPARR